MAERRLAVLGLVIGALLGTLVAAGPTGFTGLGSPVAVLGRSEARLGTGLRTRVGRATVAIAARALGAALHGS